MHLLVVTLLRAVTDLSDAGVLTAVSFVAALLSCVVLIVLGFLSVENAGFRKTWMPLLVVPCLLLGSSLGYHSLTGMETTLSLLANALLACCVVLWSRSRSLRGLALCLLSAYVSFLTRPDNGLYAWLLPPLFLVASDRRLWRYSLSYAFLFVLVLVCDGALKKVLLGDFVPLPFFAKSSGFYQGYLGTSKWNAMGEMLSFFREALPFILLAVCMASRRAIPRLVAIAVPMLVTFAYYLTVAQVMGWHSRYYYPSLPFLVLGALVAVDSARGPDADSSPSSGYSFSWRVLVALIFLLGTSPQIGEAAAQAWQKYVIGAPTVFQPRKVYRVAARSPLPPLGWSRGIVEMAMLLDRIPQDVTLAASEYGFIGSQYPKISIVDLVGLNDRQVAHHGFQADYVLSREPDLIWFPHDDYTWAVKQLVENPAFLARYDYYPGAYDYGIAVRRAARRYSLIGSLLAQEFARIYPGLKMSDYKAEPVPAP